MRASTARPIQAHARREADREDASKLRFYVYLLVVGTANDGSGDGPQPLAVGAASVPEPSTFVLAIAAAWPWRATAIVAAAETGGPGHVIEPATFTPSDGATVGFPQDRLFQPC